MLFHQKGCSKSIFLVIIDFLNRIIAIKYLIFYCATSSCATNSPTAMATSRLIFKNYFAYNIMKIVLFCNTIFKKLRIHLILREYRARFLRWKVYFACGFEFLKYNRAPSYYTLEQKPTKNADRRIKNNSNFLQTYSIQYLISFEFKSIHFSIYYKF